MATQNSVNVFLDCIVTLAKEIIEDFIKFGSAQGCAVLTGALRSYTKRIKQVISLAGLNEPSQRCEFYEGNNHLLQFTP
jgi:hypothetical protein